MPGQAFLTEYRPDIDPSTTWTLVTLDNGSDIQGQYEAGLEAVSELPYSDADGMLMDVVLRRTSISSTPSVLQLMYRRPSSLSATTPTRRKTSLRTCCSIPRCTWSRCRPRRR